MKLPPDSQYAKAPITEAVIEVRFGSHLSNSKARLAAEALKKNYSDIQEFQEIQIQVGAGVAGQPPSAKAEAQAHSYRISGVDQQEVAMILPGSLIISQLAPYCGWNQFIGRFQRDWALFTKAVERRKVIRIGLRYINRIDIPDGPGDTVAQGEYVNIGVIVPEHIGPTIGYSVQAIVKTPSKIGTAVINTSVIPMSLIPAHTSFSLDLDVGVDVDPPQDDDGILARLHQMRDEKNSLFEDLVTDKARALFS